MRQNSEPMIGRKSTEKPQGQLINQSSFPGSTRTAYSVDFSSSPGTDPIGRLGLEVLAGLNLTELHRNQAVLERSVDDSRDRRRKASLNVAHHFLERCPGKEDLINSMLIHDFGVSLG